MWKKFRIFVAKKLKLFNTIVIPVLLYGYESWKGVKEVEDRVRKLGYRSAIFLSLFITKSLHSSKVSTIYLYTKLKNQSFKNITLPPPKSFGLLFDKFS